MKLAEAIKEQRELKGWSQEELANILKVSRQSVSKWESAKKLSFLRYFDCYERFIRNLFRAFN